MLPTSKAHLWDAQQAAKAALLFVADSNEQGFYENLLIRSAVERQLEILGEALNRLRRTDPELAELVPDLHKIIAMRNILAHEYGVIDCALVWAVVTKRLKPLVGVIDTLLAGE